jgi:ssDNA-binding Zn-finger/Zn-ribbon topoisomerase 1
VPELVRVVCPECGYTAWWDDSPRVCNRDGAALVEVREAEDVEADECTVVEVRDE